MGQQLEARAANSTNIRSALPRLRNSGLHLLHRLDNPHLSAAGIDAPELRHAVENPPPVASRQKQSESHGLILVTVQG